MNVLAQIEVKRSSFTGEHILIFHLLSDKVDAPTNKQIGPANAYTVWFNDWLPAAEVAARLRQLAHDIEQAK